MHEEGAKGFANMVDGMLKAGVFEMVRMAVKPTWVGILDFEIRFPSGIEKGVEAMASVV